MVICGADVRWEGQMCCIDVQHLADEAGVTVGVY